jgi:fluoroquinolone transport system permease protein
MSAITALSKVDFKNIRRDSMMLFLLAYPIILGVLLRWMIPFVTTGLADVFDLTPYYLLLTSFFGLLIIPMLTGYLTGFLLLDERDQNTLTALMVTPLPIQTYALYRVIAPVVISIVGVLIVVPFIGVAVLPMEKLLPLALATSLLAPIFALVLSSIAKNKVQGIAVMKGMGILMLGPFVAWWVPQPWQWLLGIFPTFWPVKAYWLAAAGEPFLWVAAVGVVYTLALLLVLFKRFQENLYS